MVQERSSWYVTFMGLLEDWAVLPVTVLGTVWVLSCIWFAISVFARGNSDDMIHFFTPLWVRLLWDPKHRVPVILYLTSAFLLLVVATIGKK